MVHAKPGGGGTVEEAPRGKSTFNQMAVTSIELRYGNLDARAFVGRLRRLRRRVARSALWNRRILLPLHERRETRDVLVLVRQATRKVAGVAADVVGRDLYATLANGRGPHEVDSQAPEMGQSIFGGDAFDRATDQGGRRPGVLMVGMPGAAGQLARAKDADADFAIGCVQ